MNVVIDAKLKLRRAIWNRNARKSILNRALTQSANTLENRIKDNIDASTPAGRLYSRGPITTRRTASNKNLRLKPGTSSRVIVGYNYHQASAPGQPPAIDTGALYRSIKVRRVVGEDAIRAQATGPGVFNLDSETGLDRPFFKSVVYDYYENDFVPEMREALNEMIGTEYE